MGSDLKETVVRRALKMRNYQRARARALTRLANQYYDTYRQFLEEEKKRDEVEGKKWHSLDTRPVSRRATTREGGASATTTHQEGSSDQSNVEAEE